MHILGAGSIGCLAASRIPGATLILRNAQRLYQYQQVDQTITIRGEQDISTVVPGTCPEKLASSSISQLLISTKAQDSVTAIQPILPFLAENPVIIMLQNGIGADRGVKELLDEKNVHPRLGYAITSQGCKKTPAAFTFEQSGLGEFLYSSPDDDDAGVPDIPGFQRLEWDTFERERLYKLLANAVINPLTAILRCKNGALASAKARYLMAPIVRESCDILEACFGLNFNPQSMVERVQQIAQNTAQNTSSMLADIQAAKPTEIEFINGQLVRLGKERGVSTSYNSMLVQLVNGQFQEDAVPFEWNYLSEFLR